MSKPSFKGARRALAQALVVEDKDVEPAKLVATAVRIMFLIGRSAGARIDPEDPWVLAAGKCVLRAAAEFRDVLRRL